jgi:hypothetical protein
MLLGAGGGVVENNLLIDSPKIYLMLLEFESLSNQGSLILTTNSVLMILAINTLGNRPHNYPLSNSAERMVSLSLRALLKVVGQYRTIIP